MKRAFVVGWLGLLFVGAVNHGLVEALGLPRVELLLPHLRYGHVMFNRNLRVVTVHEVRAPDGSLRHLSELLPNDAPGYRRARVEMNLYFFPALLEPICRQALKGREGAFTIVRSRWDVRPSGLQREEVLGLRCSEGGLVREPLGAP